MKINKKLQSSDGSGHLSLTIKGILIALVPAAIAISNHFQWAITENQLMEWVDLVTISLSTAIIAVGLMKKAYNVYVKDYLK